MISLIEKLEFEMKKLNDMKARYRWGKRKKFIIQRARIAFIIEMIEECKIEFDLNEKELK